ncbi:MAG TPA: VanW family protein [Patescibacteria group bacterium]|nr:VanW family protein [Patescibacteria group bacterium]
MSRIIPNKTTVKRAVHATYWFLVGFVLAGILLSSLVLFYFHYSYNDRVIPGVFVENVYVGEKTKAEVEKIFNEKNEKLGGNTFVFKNQDKIATLSAKTLKVGYDVDLITSQTLSVGKTKNILSDVYIILSSYINGTFLTAPYTFDQNALASSLAPIQANIHKDPVDAEFNVQNNRVVAFKQSENGVDINFDNLNKELTGSIPHLATVDNPGITQFDIPIKITPPNVTTEQANNLGIVEQIGVGHSTFYHSIPGRVHNVALATSRINGALVAPGEEFSFDKMLGDVSAYTGYQQAYVIQNGKTVLGDGGGVCQVSTTLFRALLNAGLPITERHAHAYRVGYYEQDEPPGLDATTFVPTVDLKFRNDTGHYILIQGVADTTNLTMTFTLYGKSDGRVSQVSTPVISNVAPAPPDLYQDDPTLPVGTVKQVDFAAPGAKSVFTRTVTRGGKTIINDTFVSVYKPWQAVYLRGTKT